MAHAKPNIITYAVKGKLIDSIRGFTAAINWVFDFCKNFNVKKGSILKLEKEDKGEPTLSIDEDKLKTEIETVIESKKSEIIQEAVTQAVSAAVSEAVSKISSDLTISGGSDTLMTVNKNGLNFTIDVYWS